MEYTYSKEVGVRELTGKNDGPRVQEYLASVGLKGNYAWCAAFVNWCYTQCGIATPKSAWVPKWFANNCLIYKRGEVLKSIPEKGDVFGIWFPKMKRIAHIGFIAGWSESEYVITVEGNTNDGGSRDGNGVYRKRRPKRTVYAVARYIR